MSITDRRAREKHQRRDAILSAAWVVAERLGWGTFSMEKVAAEAELGRATLYSYFDSIEDLVTTMTEQAVEDLADRIAAAPGLSEALDVPVRFSQVRPAAFALLFPPPEIELHKPFGHGAVEGFRARAREILGRLQKLARNSSGTLPEDAREAAAFVVGISLAGAMIPELRASTTLRRRWQDFCLGLSALESDRDKQFLTSG